MKLFYFETPNARKPVAVAKHLNSPVEYVKIDLLARAQKEPAFLAINPNGKVPALQDGDVSLWESHAIMAYLAVKAGSDLWPSDPLAQIEALKWLNWDVAHFSRHAARITFNNYIKGLFGLGEPDPAEIEDATAYFRQFAAVLDGHLVDNAYVLGDALSVVDFGLAGFLPTAKEAKLPLDEFGNIIRWHDTLMELDAWREPWPETRSEAA